MRNHTKAQQLLTLMNVLWRASDCRRLGCALPCCVGDCSDASARNIVITEVLWVLRKCAGMCLM